MNINNNIDLYHIIIKNEYNNNINLLYILKNKFYLIFLFKYFNYIIFCLIISYSLSLLF